MGTIVAIEERDSPRAKISLDGLVREYMRSFTVVTSDYTVGALQVALAYINSAYRIPRLGEPYVYGNWSDLGAIVVDVDPGLMDPEDPTVWLVEVTYRSRSANPDHQQSGGAAGGAGGSGGSPQSAAPLFQPPQITWGTKFFQTAVYETVPVPGNPRRLIRNSADDRFADNPTVELGLRTLRIVRNEPVFDPYETSLFIKTCNDRVFQDYAPGWALCEDIQGVSAYSDATVYFTVTYDFTFARAIKGHELRLLDAGPNYKIPGELFVKHKFMSSTGYGIEQDLLNGEGGPLRDTDGHLTGDPVFLTFNVRERMNFDDLKLPDPAYVPGQP